MNTEFKNCPECGNELDLVNVSHHYFTKLDNNGTSQWSEYTERVVSEFYSCDRCDYQSEEQEDWINTNDDIKEYCSDCSKDLTDKTAWSCDSEPCILEGSNIGLLCEICATNHSIQYINHEVTKIK